VDDPLCDELSALVHDRSAKTGPLAAVWAPAQPRTFCSVDPGGDCRRVRDGLSMAGSGPMRMSPAGGIAARLLSGLLSRSACLTAAYQVGCNELPVCSERRVSQPSAGHSPRSAERVHDRARSGVVVRTCNPASVLFACNKPRVGSEQQMSQPSAYGASQTARRMPSGHLGVHSMRCGRTLPSKGFATRRASVSRLK
jgi:hypothetical protein